MVPSRARRANLSPSLHIHQCFIYASSKSSGESAHLTTFSMRAYSRDRPCFIANSNELSMSMTVSFKSIVVTA